MKDKYKKFNQYIKRQYSGFEVDYRIICSRKSFHLWFSQINENFSYKIKILRENRKQIKHWHDLHHYIRQKEQRILRKLKKTIYRSFQWS